MLLELDDLPVPLLDHIELGEPTHPVDKHVLVVGAVEDPDGARPGKVLPHPPQEVMLLLLVGGRLERVQADPLRVDSPDDPRLQRYVDTFRVSSKYSPEYGPTCLGQPEPLSGRPVFK